MNAMVSTKLVSFRYASQKLLRSKANFGILEGFLSELLFSDITIIEILESETNKETPLDKQNRVDIKVKDSSGQLILIEVQFSREQDYLFRILFESSKCVTEHLDEGKPYGDVSKVISVSILYFDFCQGDDYVYRGTTEFFGLNNQSKLELNEAQKQLFGIEEVSNIFPEHYIINIRNFDDMAKTPLDEWVYFLKNEEIKEYFSAKGLLEAKDKFSVLKLADDERLAYQAYQKDLHHQASNFQSTYVLGEMRGVEKGKVEGKIEGKVEGKVEVAINLLKSGLMDNEQVAQMTGLDLHVVAQLRLSLNENDDQNDQ